MLDMGFIPDAADNFSLIVESGAAPCFIVPR